MQTNNGKVKKNMHWFPPSWSPHRLRYILHHKETSIKNKVEATSILKIKKKLKDFLPVSSKAPLWSWFWICGIAEWAKSRSQTVFAMFWNKFDNFNFSDFTYVLFVFLRIFLEFLNQFMRLRYPFSFYEILKSLFVFSHCNLTKKN